MTKTAQEASQGKPWEENCPLHRIKSFPHATLHSRGYQTYPGVSTAFLG